MNHTILSAGLSNNNFLLQYQGRMQDFSRRGPTIFFFGFWIYMPRAAKLQAFARYVWGHAPSRKKIRNSAILCVLRAIFNNFHDKKCFQKNINKQEFFH